MSLENKDGGIRIVIEYRILNNVSIYNPFSVPSIDDILAHLGNAKFLSKMDHLKVFHQVPMTEESKPLTAFTCLQGKFQYIVMPFGLTNAPSTFQLLMLSVLRGLEHFCLPYIDDVIIYSVTFDEPHFICSFQTGSSRPYFKVCLVFSVFLFPRFSCWEGKNFPFLKLKLLTLETSLSL